MIVGPNGSGKSNITDALCFVLGRLSIKSIRAAKASHLIFSGNKDFRAANHAYVEITLDNEDGVFSVSSKDIIIRREVKKNGQGVYKISNETKTRQEVIELLSQAGIDPHGFNIILQGEIEKFVKMAPDERRKIIEEVSGISVYEMRKEKSINELEKTNEKLKQINTILRERTNYLKNLEKEREEALKFKNLEQTIEKYKFSIIKKSLLEKTKQLDYILKNIDNKNDNVKKIQNSIDKIKVEINDLNSKIDIINKTFQKYAGVEQDKLIQEISEIRQEIAGLSARKENFENQLNELDRRKNSLENNAKNTEENITIISKEKGKNKKQDLEKKKNQLDEIEENKEKHYLVKSNLQNINNQISDKEYQIKNLKNEANVILKQIEDIEEEIKIKGDYEDHKKEIDNLENNLNKNKKLILEKQELLIDKEKICAVEIEKIKDAENLKSQVSKLDICPLCKTKITKEHINEVIHHSENTLNNSRLIIEKNKINIFNLKEEIKELNQKISKNDEEISLRKIIILKIYNIKDKKDNLARDNNKLKSLEKEIDILIKKKKDLEEIVETTKISGEDYEKLKLEINELMRSEERNLGAEIVGMQRELERIKIAIKQNIRDKNEISQELIELNERLQEKTNIVLDKESKAEMLKKKYQKMIEEKNGLQDKVRVYEIKIMNEQNEKRVYESEVNNFNIEKAQINTKIDNLNDELKNFNSNIYFVNISIDKLKEKLSGAERIINQIGNVNLRALEVYDNIKSEYDKIKEKVDQLGKEKEEITNTIAQIDKKKKKTFMETLNNINILFSRNFLSLSNKGEVSIVPIDKDEVFNAGLDILVKVGPGKYFDVTSLSGGEQTLVSLALIFAIQELHPYSFYIFDEIDAALDRRNSERLAYLLKKHMNKGQYLIITHNDSIISENSNILYGVSMQDGISKVLSIKID